MLSTDIFKTAEITPSITRIIMPGAVFGYLIKGSEKAVVIDTGFGAGPLRQFIEELLNGFPYEVVLTHGHLDHVGGAGEFEKVWMHPADLKVAEGHSNPEMRLNFIKQSNPEATIDDIIGPKEEFEPLNYGDRFDLGDETLEIVNLGGHTPGSVGILFEKQRILLAGDAVCSFTLMFGGDQSLTVSQYRDNISKTWNDYKDRFDTVLYSHPHNYGGPEIFPQMIDLCNDILEGKDDRIESRGMFGGKTYIGRKADEKGRQPDGRIANLQYAEDCLR
ncbi:MAG: MBL fold metallo-hydrolase [Erysipelotrichaceae bacterium]|nr:MBL fold metallo-hydrolase [Erysipelotrichaceae bacterium]